MLLTAPAVLAFALLQSSDRIVLRNGQVIPVDRVQTETFTEVTYRKGGSDGRKPANEVLEVEHSTSARQLGDYADALELIGNGDYRRAISALEVVLKDKDLSSEPRFAWTKQHSLYRMMECYAALGDLNQIAATADRLLTTVPDTFFYAPALLSKAQALQDKNDAKGAEAVYKQLESDVRSKGLPEVWARQSELGLVMLDRSLSAADKQRKLEGIAEKNKSAPEFADVASRARVQVGNAMVEAGQYKDAKARFGVILESGTSDGAVLAAAYSGLGDCAFNIGLQEEIADVKKAAPYFEEAALHFLRVAATYPEEYRLAPRAMCFAGMAMRRLGKRDDALQMARKLKGNFPDSAWKTKLFQDMGLAG